VTSAGYLRYPHVSHDLLTFVAEDDVWLAPATGGRAWRLSADAAAAAWPRLSRDGAQVAWSATEDGASEIYLADAGGGPSRRLTYWGDPAARVCGWSPAVEILAVTSAGQPFSHLPHAHAITPGDGAPATRLLPFGPASDIAIEPGSVALLTGGNGDPAWRKRYRGGTSGRIWLQDGSAQFRQLLADVAGHFASPMLIGGRLAFVSDHEGTGNIYSVAPDGSDLRRHTDHDGPYARQASTDGQRVVYQCRGELWLLDGLDAASPAPVEISLGSASPGRAPRLVSAADHVGGLSVDHTGQASAVEVRGTVHWLTHRDGPARALAVTPGVRARLPRVLGGDGMVAWVTDAQGADAVDIGQGQPDPGEPGAEPRRLAAGAIGRVADLAGAPDGSAVAVAARDGYLRLIDIASGAVTELAASDDGEVSGLAWSGDSAWLAWSQPGPQPMRRIRIARISDGAVYDLTDGRFADSDPVFCGDGRYLAFLSKRDFDPVYDAHFFDLSFPYGARPYLVPLAASTPSPFAPQPGGRPIGGGHKKEKADDADAPAAVSVDTDGLAMRVVALPVPESRYSSLRTVQGGLAWLREPVTGNLGQGLARPGEDAPRPDLERFDFERQSVAVLAEDVDWFDVSGDGSRIVVSDEGSLSVLPGDRKPDPDNPDDHVRIDASRARFRADPVALWRHAFDEAGRIMAHDFWVPDMAGVDWSGTLAEYRPFVERLASQAEFADLLWEVFGELGTSHAYVSPGIGAGNPAGPSAAGLLGADLRRDADGGWRIARIVPGESSDARARSPLAGPGAQLTAGGQLIAVDGQPVGPDGPGPLLVGTAGKPVELTVSASDGSASDGSASDRSASAGSGSDGGSLRRVVVTPLSSERRLRYLDWVAGRRAEARELSDGRLGYLHVPDMVSEGWADFHRDLRGEMRRDGLILDVRGNRGGHTSQLVIEKLARRIIAWQLPTGMQPVSYPVDAPRGPIVALSDEWAGSDGDIVTAAIKARNIGPVVGARTWGGVIGIDVPLHELVDGTQMSVPRYAFWFDAAGWGVENYGVDPDVEVLISPDDWAAGQDPQLQTAVRMALAALEQGPPASPPDLSDRPARTRPPLPPRGA
jgi:tricorn protease